MCFNQNLLMKYTYTFILFFIVTSFQTVFANQYTIPGTGDDVIGAVYYAPSNGNETLLNLGETNNIGYNAMTESNPGYPDNAPLPNGQQIKIPSKFILPPLPRRGIVINLAEMRLYYYPEGSQSVFTFPIGIGKVGKTVPMGNTSISRKTVNPTWTPPKDIREFNRQQGIELPQSMGPGPDNPLGPYALYLKVPTYLIHSTIFPESIGRRASFGCIRMNEGDIKQFYPLVQPGTPVAIVNIPTKIGWDDGRLFLETHAPLEEHEDGGITNIVSSIQHALPVHSVTLINWQLVSYLSEQRDGVPHEVGFKVN